MTVTYTAEVATCKNFGCFLKLLARWKGSVYKLVWMDLIVFLILYFALSALYRFALNDDAKTTFENIANYCNSYGSLIPLSFVLGFYVSIVMQRWWDQYMTIPWPDPVAVYVSVHVHGQDERGRVMRRTVMRYVCLCQTIVFTLISQRVKKRFPTLQHLVDAGLLLENEKKVIEGMDTAFPKHPKHWMPIVWASSIITRARKEGRIRDDFAVKTIIDGLNKFRGMCGVLMYYNTISVPLVYTQVVTLAVYTYFLCSIMGQQWTESSNEDNYPNLVDFYFPVFSTLQFFFYMGWLKVAESLINPFGDDDDDFEVNWMVDRNLQVSYLIVDEMHHEHPELVKDQYWDEVFPNELPYANDTDGKREEPPEPSTAKLDYAKSLLSSFSILKTEQKPSSSQLNGTSSQNLRENDNLFSNVLRRFISREGGREVEKKPSISSVESGDKRSAPNGDLSIRRSEIVHISNEIVQDIVDEQASTASNITSANFQENSQENDQSNERNLRDDTSAIDHESSNGNDDNGSSKKKNDFDRLREERRRARRELQRQKFIRNVRNAVNLHVGQNVANVDVEQELNATLPIVTVIIPSAQSAPSVQHTQHSGSVATTRQMSQKSSATKEEPKDDTQQ